MLQIRPNGRRRSLGISGRAGAANRVTLNNTKAPLYSWRLDGAKNEQRRDAEDQLNRSLGRGRCARLKSKAPRLGAALRVIEGMLDPPEAKRHRQGGRRRRK